ncbi:hypothetical protein D8M09_03260 [Enterobacter sp. R1(2018)]|nr:hypothetical protein D8M09_03260 [Enterobacter sp. R1(2018)]
MKMNEVRLLKGLLIVPVLIICGGLILKYYEDYKMDHFSCETQFDTQMDKKRLTGVMAFSMNGGKGRIAGSFTLLDDGNSFARVNRVMNFNYTRSGNSYTMISEDTFDSKHIAFLRAVLPDFYLFERSGLQLDIYSQGNGAYVFARSNLTILYCANTNYLNKA